MDRSTLQLTIGILLGIFLLVLVILTVVYVRRRLAEKRETAMRDPDIFQDESLRDDHSESKGYWLNKDDLEEADQSYRLRYYHYFDNIDECIQDLIVEMYDCGFVRTEDIFVAAYGEDALTPDSFISTICGHPMWKSSWIPLRSIQQRQIRTSSKMHLWYTAARRSPLFFAALNKTKAFKGDF